MFPCSILVHTTKAGKGGANSLIIGSGETADEDMCFSLTFPTVSMGFEAASQVRHTHTLATSNGQQTHTFKTEKGRKPDRKLSRQFGSIIDISSTIPFLEGMSCRVSSYSISKEARQMVEKGSGTWLVFVSFAASKLYHP